MEQSPDDLAARELLEHWRRMGEIIDENSLQRAREVVRDHVRDMHPEAEDLPTAPSNGKLSDDEIYSVITQAARERVSHFYVCEMRNIAWPRFQVDLADYERRFKEAERKARFGW